VGANPSKPDLADIKSRLARWDSWTKDDVRQFIEHDLPSVIAYCERLEALIAELYEKNLEGG
jgi:hypothetical protein